MHWGMDRLLDGIWRKICMIKNPKISGPVVAKATNLLSTPTPYFSNARRRSKPSVFSSKMGLNSLYLASGSLPFVRRSAGSFSKCRNSRSNCKGEVLRSRRHLRVRAQNENPDAIPKNMTEEEALTILGVRKDASFDEVLTAKNKLIESAGGEQSRAEEISAAYDLLLMASMRRRLTGNEQVPTSVRFADVRRKKTPAKQAQDFLQQLPGGGINVEAPSSNILLTNSLAFVPLGGWVLLQGLATPPQGYDVVPGFPLAVAVAWSVYSFREFKLMGLGRAVGYTTAALVAGAVMGGVLESAIRIDEHPFGPLHSPATFVSEFAMGALWAATAFLS